MRFEPNAGQAEASVRAVARTDRYGVLLSATGALLDLRGDGAESSSVTLRLAGASARSEVSFEDAVKQGVARAAETLRNVSGAWVKEQKAEVTDGSITAYNVILEVTFVLDD